MAILNNPLLQGASGKIGGCVAYTVGNKTYARKLADTISNPRSEGQTTQRSKLPGAQTMYRATRGSVLEKVYALVARKEERRSGYHWFLHANMNMFGPNDYIDYPRLILSDGSLQLPFGMKTAANHIDKLELEWLDNTSTVTAQATDQLTVAAIFDNEPYQPVVLEDTGYCRSDGKAIVHVPEGSWTTVHLYCFFAALDGKRYSPCMYFSISKS